MFTMDKGHSIYSMMTQGWYTEIYMYMTARNAKNVRNQAHLFQVLSTSIAVMKHYNAN